MKDKGRSKILLAHGGGGQLSDELIRRTIQPRFKDSLTELADSARVNLGSSKVCFTTDSYVVKPLFFNGGDIGKLAVCGTVNDLAVAGSRPVVLALSLIIEEGFEFELLEKILDSISQAAKTNDVSIVTGDTKTVEVGAADGIFINTAGIGARLAGVDLGFSKIAVGDKIIINGTIGDHGMTIISQREGIYSSCVVRDAYHEKQTRHDTRNTQYAIRNTILKSDCAGIAGLTCQLLQNTGGVKFMRDPTRGGLAATLNEISRGSGLSIEIRQADIPVNPTVQAGAEMLGFDVLNIANEGKFAAIVSPESVDDHLNTCKKHPLGKEASIIGEIVKTRDVPVVEMVTRIGGKRIVQMPYGRELPRIC